MNSTNTTTRKRTANSYLRDKSFMDNLSVYAMRLNRGNVQNADDLVQETVLIIKTKFHLYNDSKNIPFIVWARQVMKNNFINEYRKQTRTNSFIHSYDADPDSYYKNNLRSIDRTPYQILEVKEKEESIEEIKQVIQRSVRLKSNSKRAIILKMEGHKIKDIAKILNVPFNSAKSFVYTDIKKITDFNIIKDIFYKHHTTNVN